MLRKLRYALRRMPIADSQARSVRHDCGAVTRCDDSQGCQPPIERPRLASARALSDAWAPATEPGAAQHSTVHPARIAPWWLGFPHASVRACTCNCARGICACADVWYVCAACAILWFGGFTAHGNARGQSTCACARRIAFGVYGRPGDIHGRFQPPSGLPSPQGCRSQCGRRARVQPWCCRFCTEHSGGQRSGGVWQEQCRSLDRRWHVDVHTHWVRLHRRRSCKAASKAILHTHLATAHHARSTAPPCACPLHCAVRTHARRGAPGARPRNTSLNGSRDCVSFTAHVPIFYSCIEKPRARGTGHGPRYSLFLLPVAPFAYLFLRVARLLQYVIFLLFLCRGCGLFLSERQAFLRSPSWPALARLASAGASKRRRLPCAARRTIPTRISFAAMC